MLTLRFTNTLYIKREEREKYGLGYKGVHKVIYKLLTQV